MIYKNLKKFEKDLKNLCNLMDTMYISGKIIYQGGSHLYLGNINEDLENMKKKYRLVKNPLV